LRFSPEWYAIQLRSMRSLKTTLCVAVIVLLLATVVYVRRDSRGGRSASVSREAAKLLTRERQKKTAKFNSVIQERLRAREAGSAGAAVGAVTKATADEKVAELKETFDRLPEQRIPELELATAADWYAAVEGNDLLTTDDFRRALSKVRNSALRRFGKLAQPAVRAYLAANDGKFPTEGLELLPLATGVTESMLQRYKAVPAIQVASVRVGGDWALTQTSIVDPELDFKMVIGPNGSGGFTSGAIPPETVLLEPALKAYMASNHGAPPDEVSQLLPYASTQTERDAIAFMKQELDSRVPKRPDGK
jgi:hypothetical protein